MSKRNKSNRDINPSYSKKKEKWRINVYYFIQLKINKKKIYYIYYPVLYVFFFLIKIIIIFVFFVFISVSLYCDIYIYKILIIYNKDVPKICLKI